MPPHFPNGVQECIVPNYPYAPYKHPASFEMASFKLINGVTFLGPDLFSLDSNGKLLTPIALALPELSIIAAGRGIHAELLERIIAFLDGYNTLPFNGSNPPPIDDLYRDAVSLFIRGEFILIQTDPANMERAFAADELLQHIFPKEKIQFTGVHLREVRKKLRQRGESWRISPAPRSFEQISRFIEGSRVQVRTGISYYHNMHNGGRYLTYEEFSKIRPLLWKDPGEALSRLKEIVFLTSRVNAQCIPELRFFVSEDAAIPTDLLNKLIRKLEAAREKEPGIKSAVVDLFDQILNIFAQAAGPELRVDGVQLFYWRITMFFRLSGINEKEVEERALGLSPEFHLNIRWLPGGKIIDHSLRLDTGITHHVRGLIEHYWRTWPDIQYINLGRVEASQTRRSSPGEEREIYVIVFGLADGKEEIRLVRMMKWDVAHRLKLGMSPEQAIQETYQYRDYIFDRLNGITRLGIPIPAFREIQLEEQFPGLGPIPVFFFDRQYVPGVATEKIPPAFYARAGFIVQLAGFLGKAAAASISLGRTSPRTGQLYFDDGDELIRFDDKEWPLSLIIVDTTGSFTDIRTPLKDFLPQCVDHLILHLEKAQNSGIPTAELCKSVDAFSNGLISEIRRLQGLLREDSPGFHSFFDYRDPKPGGVRWRWGHILSRLESADTQELARGVKENKNLAAFFSRKSSSGL